MLRVAVSFTVATLSMVVVLLTTLLLTDAPKPQLARLAKMPWWGWLGAFCGATYVTTVFTAIPVIGTAPRSVSRWPVSRSPRSSWTATASFRLPRRGISALRFSGVVLLLIGRVHQGRLLPAGAAHGLIFGTLWPSRVIPAPPSGIIALIR